MPADKWGIPFFYPTAENAGVTNKGEGFFWQQNKDIFEDNEDGMVRLGKEQDDVEVINESTGEFEFPFAVDDYFCMEVRQGHKSGGEEHGCEGSCYIYNVKINQTPAKFYWQKQMYHGGSKYKHSTGEFGHSKVTEKVIGNGWKGFAAVIYNKENGRSTGHDSAILEIWWNEDPVNNLKNGWFMVKRIEDKGGWGKDGDSCDGMDDQVITWSNIQFRFKSGTPDFSLHPLIPEYEDGPVIHSIGEEDMSFEDSEKRGYGKRADMPANVEMKCLFKFDSNNGKCRLKNLSLREIDANKSFDDTPDNPTGGEQPGETHTITGKFKLQWDLNTDRVSDCAGPGYVLFYNLSDTDIDEGRAITNHIDNEYRTRVGEKVSATLGGVMVGKTLKQLDIPLKKVGSPGASPTIRAKIYNSSGGVIYTSPTAIDPTTLTTSYTTQVFDFSGNTNTFVVGQYVAVEYTGTSDVNYIDVGITTTNKQIGGSRLSYYADDGTSGTFDTSDMVCKMYE